MTRLEDLTRLMRELEDQLTVCMKCGLCQSVCPVFEETGREADVARGKLALLEGLLQAMVEDPAGVSARLDKCLLCGSCEANCPSGVGALEIFLKARTILSGYMGLSPAKRILLRGMLSRPALFDRMAEWGVRFQKLFTRPVSEVIGTSCARVSFPFVQGRHFRRLAQIPFHRQTPSMDNPVGKSGMKVAFFTGCLIDKLYPEIARCVLEVLDHHGVGVFIPDDQGCCGIPALSSGDIRTFEGLVTHNLKRFENSDFDYLVTACATCTSTLHHIWPKFADSTSRSAAVEMAGKTLDICQFLSRNNLINPIPSRQASPRTITYHDPCHLKKSMNVWKEPREIVLADAANRIVEMTEPDRCCGMGGSFNLFYYEVSKKIGERKAEQILATNASVLATGCPACMIQISDMLSRSGSVLAVRHPIELYAEAIRKKIP